MAYEGLLFSTLTLDLVPHVQIVHPRVFQTAHDFHEFKSFQFSLSSEGYFGVFDHATLKKLCLLLFTIPYKAMPHWKGQRLNFQKKKISKIVRKYRAAWNFLQIYFETRSANANQIILISIMKFYTSASLVLRWFTLHRRLFFFYN